MRTELEKESEAWRAKPFSFTPSPALYGFLARMRVQWASGSRKQAEAKSCMCQNCGSVIVVGKARNYRGSIHPEVYCDKECAEADRSRVYRMRRIGDKTILSKGLMPRSMASKVVFCDCRHCHRRFASASGRNFCSDGCREDRSQSTELENRRKVLVERINRQRRNATEHKCVQCGCAYTSLRQGEHIYCSQRCTLKKAKMRREHIKRTSANFGGTFSAREVFDAANWKCKQCKCKVQPPDGTYNESEATVDHIVPVSKGGLHVWSNVQCLCRACNSSKSDKLTRPMQLAFL